MILGRFDLKSDVKEAEHDVSRKPLMLFGIMLWAIQNKMIR